MARPIFTLRLAWESERHSPSWELQTEHPGFSNWIAPALFANRATSPYLTSLELAAGNATLTLDTGAAIHVGGDGRVLLTPATQRKVAAGELVGPRSLPGLARIQLSAWRLPQDESDELAIATCDAYQELRGATIAHLSDAGLDGRWRPRSFEILGPDGHVPVTLELDESGQFLVARIEDEPLAESVEDTAAISLIPKA
jgi:hypothetical protein